jgi:hypothetical protein
VTKTLSDKLNVMKSCSSPNHSSDEMKRLSDESCLSQKTIFLVVSLNCLRICFKLFMVFLRMCFKMFMVS